MVVFIMLYWRPWKDQGKKRGVFANDELVGKYMWISGMLQAVDIPGLKYMIAYNIW